MSRINYQTIQNGMFIKIKPALIIVAATLLLSMTIPQSAIGYMFGKRFDTTRDFSCCKGDQLYVHHYYTFNFFWVESGSGFTSEPVGKPAKGGCNIQCDD
jgi:hypothetical protein